MNDSKSITTSAGPVLLALTLLLAFAGYTCSSGSGQSAYGTTTGAGGVLIPRRADPRIDPHEPDYLQDIDLHKWPNQRMPLKIYIEPGEERGFDARLGQLILKAFSQWLCTDSSLRLTPVNSWTEADITVERPAYGEIPNGMGGRTMYDYETLKTNSNPNIKPAVIRARVYLICRSNNANDLSEAEDNTLYSLALHEAGHALGMDGHSSNSDDILFAKSTGMSLSRQDLASIAHSYPKTKQ